MSIYHSINGFGSVRTEGPHRLRNVSSFENWGWGGGAIASDLRKLRKHYNTRSSFRHGLPEPRLTWMSPAASCGPGCQYPQ